MSVIYDPTVKRPSKPANQKRRTGQLIRVPVVHPTKRNHNRRPPQQPQASQE